MRGLSMKRPVAQRRVMSSKQPLTVQDVEQYTLRAESLRYIEAFRARLGIERSKMRVLDWGCGRGRAVVKLRAHGYDAYGADVDAVALDNGRRFFVENGDPNADTRLRLINESGYVDFPDGYFHFILSETVLEHVRNIHAVARELGRLTALEGEGFHVFPAWRCVMEAHLRMPFVHWLPKNNLRRLLIAMCTGLGLHARWDGATNLRGWTQLYFDYSVDRTYYRRCRELRGIFETGGFGVHYVSIDHPRVAQHRLLGKCIQVPLLRKRVEWLLLNFNVVEMLTTKQPRADGSIDGKAATETLMTE